MDITRVFKALSDRSRVRTLCALQGQELCVCQIVELLELAPSTVSKHLSILASSGLVEGTKKGRWVYYRLVEDRDSAAGVLLNFLPTLVEREPQLGVDRHTLSQILMIDPETLCRKQSG